MVRIAQSAGLLAALVAVLCLGSGPAGAQDEDMEDILGGFDDDDDGFEVDREAIEDVAERWWDLSGSFEVSASINYRSHTSATGTDYGGLQRLRNRLNLQFDAALPHDWKARIEGWAFYDAAYLAQQRDHYTTQVLDEYEWDWDLREVYLQGKLLDDLDLKVGRQIVIWGRSESLRVLDVLNPLDFREPGRVDLEDLRRPLGMIKLDAYDGDWTFTAIAIPEIRFSLEPPVGSDFNPFTSMPDNQDPESFEHWEFAGSVTGTFSGWDISFHAASFFEDAPRTGLRLNLANPVRLQHDRIWMLGTGGNYTIGGWLLKGELAFLDGFTYDRPDLSAKGPRIADADKARLDVLLGVEYYGIVDTSMTVEVVNRYLFGHGGSTRRSFGDPPENRQEVSLRITRNFMRERLEVTALAVLVAESEKPAAILRLDAEYELQDAVFLSGGILFFQEGNVPVLDTWGRNDRFFASIKWNF